MRFTKAVSFLAISVLCSAFTPGDELNCSEECTNITATIPSGDPGSSMTIITILSQSNGSTPLEQCPTTCDQCKTKLRVEFLPGDSGYSVVNNFGGSSWSTPVNQFNRTGWLKAICNGDDSVTFAVGNAADLLASPAASTTILLLCECDL